MNSQLDDDLKNKVIHILHECGYDVSLDDKIGGGVISSVFEGTLFTTDGHSLPIVVKHTRDRQSPMPPPFYERIDHFLSAKSQDADAYFLRFFNSHIQFSSQITLPKVYGHFPEFNITILENLKYCSKKFRLLSEIFPEALRNIDFANNLGSGIAFLNNCLVHQTPAPPYIEDQLIQFEERGLGLLMAFPNSQRQFRKFLQAHLSHQNRQLICTDLHPKNLFYSVTGEVAVIDFGRTTYGDPQYQLSNFLAHIIIYWISDTSNFIHACDIHDFISQIVESYERHTNAICHTKFCEFIGAEILSRANGRWIDYFGENDIKTKSCLSALGQSIFSRNVNRIETIVAMSSEFKLAFSASFPQ